MNRENRLLYIEICKNAGIPKTAILRNLCKDSMEKKGWLHIPALAWWLLAGTGAGIGHQAYSNYGQRQLVLQNMELEKQKEKNLLLEKAKGLSGEKKYTVPGAIAGGLLGYHWGPTLFEDLEPTKAKMIGAGVGGLGGAILGSMV